MAIVTKPTSDGGRSVKFSNSKAPALIEWLGDALIKASQDKKGVVSLKIKTPKGPRVANVGDVIVKYGVRRNGGKVTFTVEKL